MFSKQTHRDTQPFAYIGRLPVYVTTVVVLLTAVMSVVVFLMQSSWASPELLFFNPVSFWKEGKVWQLLTHAFIGQLNFFFLFGLFFIWSMGNGIETHLGRRAMIRLILLLCIFPALVSSMLWLVTGYSLQVGGVITLSMGLIIAFATLYPNVEWWNVIPMKWIAGLSIAFGAIQFFPFRDWLGLSAFLSLCVASHIYTRYEMGHWSLPSFSFLKASLKRRPKISVVPKAEMGDSYDPPVAPELDDEVNRILDKIAKTGLSSLDSKEREVLQRARETLMKKESR